MRNVLFVTLIGSFCFTISCAQKSISPDKVTLEKPPVVEVAPQAVVEAKPENDNEYNCKVAGDDRVVRLNKVDKKCTVDYTKNGDTKEVAWGQTHPEICQNAFEKIRTNIESAGFKCDTSSSNEPSDKKMKTAQTK